MNWDDADALHYALRITHGAWRMAHGAWRKLREMPVPPTSCLVSDWISALQAVSDASMAIEQGCTIRVDHRSAT
jgi:hypothetical protein